MTQSSFAAAVPPGPLVAAGEYQPGVCNIGPEEIASRRRAGHLGLIATVALFVALVVVGAPPIARLLVALPATIAASGYLQAWFKFCAGFGSRGVFNFGRVGTTEQVQDADARRLDKARATRIGGAALLIGLATGIVAVLLPV